MKFVTLSQACPDTDPAGHTDKPIHIDTCIAVYICTHSSSLSGHAVRSTPL